MNHLPPDVEALIADATTGHLSPEDARRLDALAADDPAVAAALEEQRLIADELGIELEPMTELERRRMRFAVLEEVVPPPAAAPWVRWTLSAAAVLVVVLGGLAIFTGGLGGNDSLGQTADVGAAETTVAEAERDEPDGADSAFEGDDEAIEESTAADADDAGEPATDAPTGDGDLAGAAPAEPFPACVGEVEEVSAEARVAEDLADLASLDEALERLTETPWVVSTDQPFVVALDDTAILTWFVDGTVDQQVELQRSGDQWVVNRRITCSR